MRVARPELERQIICVLTDHGASRPQAEIKLVTSLGAVVGIGCDVTYGTSFLTSLVYWALKDPSIVRFGKPSPKASASS